MRIRRYVLTLYPYTDSVDRGTIIDGLRLDVGEYQVVAVVRIVSAAASRVRSVANELRIRRGRPSAVASCERCVRLCVEVEKRALVSYRECRRRSRGKRTCRRRRVCRERCVRRCPCWLRGVRVRRDQCPGRSFCWDFVIDRWNDNERGICRRRSGRFSWREC